MSPKVIDPSHTACFTPPAPPCFPCPTLRSSHLALPHPHNRPLHLHPALSHLTPKSLLVSHYPRPAPPRPTISCSPPHLSLRASTSHPTSHPAPHSAPPCSHPARPLPSTPPRPHPTPVQRSGWRSAASSYVRLFARGHGSTYRLSTRCDLDVDLPRFGESSQATRTPKISPFLPAGGVGWGKTRWEGTDQMGYDGI